VASPNRLDWKTVISILRVATVLTIVKNASLNQNKWSKYLDSDLKSEIAQPVNALDDKTILRILHIGSVIAVCVERGFFVPIGRC
jgi:hypothetical protein